MKRGWSHRSFPELASLSPTEQDRVWKRCCARAARHRVKWLMFPLMFALFVSGSLLHRYAGAGWPAWVRIAFPSSVAAVVGAGYAVFLIRTARRYLPAELPGHCRGCGYDLAGNVSGVCPECGKPMDAG